MWEHFNNIIGGCFSKLLSYYSFVDNLESNMQLKQIDFKTCDLKSWF